MPQQRSRRAVLAAGGAVSVATLAGCTALVTGDDGSGGGRWAADSVPLAASAAHQYSSPGCSCCSRYVDHLAGALDGGLTESVPDDVDSVKREHGVPESLAGCHTVVLGDAGYVLEGHVPAAAVETLLDEQPDVDGIAVPGMPPGTPGMGGEPPETLAVYAFGGGRTGEVYVEL
jgi:hypothetical protein